MLPLILLIAATDAGAAPPVEVQTVNDLLRLPAVRAVKASQGLLLGVTSAGPRVVAVGEKGRIIYSDDAGSTWTQADVPVCVTLTAVSFPTAQKGWAVGHDGVVLHSSDGGKRWAKQLDGNMLNARAYAQLEKMAKAAGVSGSKANDAGGKAVYTVGLDIYLKDLQVVKDEGATLPLLDVWFADEREGFVVGAFGMAARTSDGGATWNPILDRLDNPQGLHYYAITPVGRDLYIAGESGMLLRSEDRGRTWKKLESPYEGSYFGIIGTRDGKAVIAFGLRGSAFRSTDRGKSWKPISVPTGAAWMGGAQLPDGFIVLASPALGGMMSTDGGATFSAVPNFPAGSVAVTATQEGKVVAVGMSGAQSVPMKRTDLKGKP